MRVFEKRHRLSRLPLAARLTYSGFCIFILCGLVTAIWLYIDDGMTARPADAVTYYLGATSGPGGEGPAAASPTEGKEKKAKESKTRRTVHKTLHFHLFTTALCLLVITHLFMLGPLSEVWKSAFIGVGYASTLIHMLTPWLIQDWHADFAWVMFPSGALMLLVWMGLAAGPVFWMWRPSADRANR